MCIIIHKPAGITLPRDIYEECANCNDDGMGFACAHDGQLEVVKGLFKFDEFYDRIKELEQNEMIIHFRIASAGMVINQKMCHPFESDTKTTFETEDHKPLYKFAIVHNGRIEWPVIKDTSDTYSFVQQLLGPLFERDPFFLDQPSGLKLLEKAMVTKNKLAIMRWDEEEKVGKVFIINKTAGNENHGCWFSNMSWKKVQSIQSHADWENDYGNGYGAYGLAKMWRDKSGNVLSEKVLGREFLDPDQDGWKWSRTMGCWFNIKTQQSKDKLSNRKRPAYMETKDKDKNEEKSSDVTFHLSHLKHEDKLIYFRLVKTFAREVFGFSESGHFQSELALFRFEVLKAFPSERDKSGFNIEKWQDKEVDKWVLINLFLVRVRLGLNKRITILPNVPDNEIIH